MPVVLAREEDGLAPLDAHHRAISIAHCAANVGVEVGESRAHCCHVVRRPSVEEPTGAPPPLLSLSYTNSLFSSRWTGEAVIAAVVTGAADLGEGKDPPALTSTVATNKVGSISSSTWATWAALSCFFL
jgi:hypothetical protein